VQRRELAAANHVLATLKVPPGNFYRQLTPHASPARRGWRTGTSGSSRLRAQGAQTETRASTVPYRDPIL